MPGSIGVLESLDKFMPIGEAHCLTWNVNRLAVWTLRIGKQGIPGRWVIVDREFRPAPGEAIGCGGLEVHNKKIRPFKVTEFTPFQISVIDLDEYIENRR